MEKYDSSKEDESDEDRDREAIGGVIALFVISVVLRRLDEVVMLVGARGVLFNPSTVRDGRRGWPWHVKRRLEYLSIFFLGCHETVCYLEHVAGSCRVILIRGDECEVGAVVE